MVKAGATRIGASASVKIIGNGKPTASQAQPEQKGY
jgi:deoxyribose-phosphate aldolase